MRLFSQISRQLTLAAVILCMASAVPVFGDGCYLPHKNYLQIPTIPAQTAIISYHDGQETLVVQSLLDAEGQEFGWIIPVPAPPTEMRVGTAGLIKTFQVQLQPKIITDRDFNGLSFLLILVLVITFWGLHAIYNKPGKVSFLSLLAWICLISILAAGSISLGVTGSRLSTLSGIHLEDRQTIGHYDVVTLRATSAKVLNDWLEANDLRTLDATAQAIVENYIHEGWSFVTARLLRENSGLSEPHPIVLTFPAQQPVYPMRLTALTGHSVHLELFLIGDRQWKCRNLTMQYSDQFSLQKQNDESDSWPQFRGFTYHATIGHSEAMTLLWQGCVVTKLVGDVKPKEMAADYQFQSVTDGSPYQQVVFSKSSALRESFCVGSCAWSLGLLLTVGLYLKLINGGEHRLFLTQALLILLVFSVALSLENYLVQEKIDVRDAGGRYLLRVRERNMKELAVSYLAKNPTDNAQNVAEGIKKLFNNSGALAEPNPYLGGKVTNEDSPGNFEVIKRNGKVDVRIYREDGSFIEVER